MDDVPEVDGFGGGGGGGFDSFFSGSLVSFWEADEVVALLAMAKTVDAMDGFSPPPSKDPLDTCRAAEANAPGLDLPSSGAGASFSLSVGSSTMGLHFSCIFHDGM